MDYKTQRKNAAIIRWATKREKVSTAHVIADMHNIGWLSVFSAIYYLAFNQLPSIDWAIWWLVVSWLANALGSGLFKAMREDFEAK